MKRLIALCCIAALTGCAASEEAADADDDMMPTIALADLAGTWSLRAMMAESDSVITEYEISATDTREGWTMMFPGRDPVPLEVRSVDGDSVVLVSGPYESLLRAGVMVSVRSVARLHGEMMMGTFMARYETTEADSMLSGRFEGTRGM